MDRKSKRDVSANPAAERPPGTFSGDPGWIPAYGCRHSTIVQLNGLCNRVESVLRRFLPLVHDGYAVPACDPARHQDVRIHPKVPRCLLRNASQYPGVIRDLCLCKRHHGTPLCQSAHPQLDGLAHA